MGIDYQAQLTAERRAQVKSFVRTRWNGQAPPGIIERAADDLADITEQSDLTGCLSFMMSDESDAMGPRTFCFAVVGRGVRVVLEADYLLEGYHLRLSVRGNTNQPIANAALAADGDSYRLQGPNVPTDVSRDAACQVLAALVTAFVQNRGGVEQFLTGT